MIGVLIEIFDKKAKTYILEERLRLFTKEGEEEVEFDDGYWKWLIKKLGYEGEEISFFVSTDEEKFEIPQIFNISKVNVFEDKEFEYKEGNVFTFPEFKRIKKPKKTETPKPKIKKTKNPFIEFLQKKTEEYNG